MDPVQGSFFTFHGRITTALLAMLGSALIYHWVGRRKLGMAYGLVWLSICFALLAVAVFPVLLVYLGNLAGTREPEGALRLAGFVFVAIILLYLSLKVSALEAKLESLVQALALQQALLASSEAHSKGSAQDASDQRAPSA